MMTMKNIEMAYEEIYDFLDEIDSHPLSAQISLPVPDLIDGAWIDKYLVYEDVAINGKHIAYEQSWIFAFLDGKMYSQQYLEKSDLATQYTIPFDVKSMEVLLERYIECYEQIKFLRPAQEEMLNNYRIINQYLEVFKKVIPKEMLMYYSTTSTQLKRWLYLTDDL